ncbi:MAG: histidine--tRNA ligase [Candidatus Dactylopiibacterium carminicum]|uniref:Histidine--tRNA ligase n=1 Tax=Candidatus Dactylopiibacterium carminicum TaxID=857335 RepID=A0A272EZ35_9RHOO|nr:histidine--tRNA ligase [Candidatus Dactylopiibacterium carminicum]KAF7600872.1 histidine--tRNA ligase [Candidatus Dactylopiibacterium carminicum]PAS95371.1 MAG: histidine--tRNA ligase [Candidatus Dactylopiibacterium carminicum]PAS98618.1 MAG: histidine--tRNA ligase [Candidatus Dactylopiibacterium carminicum]PAT00871.1 MAG: histidine--tRNA ligase [Candidatus Dactylopiibacterium carminicum]
MSTKLQGVRGMNDLLPDEAERWEAFEEIVRDWLKSYGYRPIRSPIVEPTALFHRGVGEHTDIVEKEMYSFEDRLNGEQLTLRPEGTASCVRSVIEHNLLFQNSQRLYYSGPMFRHERPQKGRYRQFHQVGVEALGFAGPDIDAEHIVMCRRLWDDLGLEDVELQLNSLGDAAERATHRAELIAYLERHQDQLDEDGKRRLHANPLRVLDTKNPALQDIVDAAPKLLDYLGAESLKHFEAVQAMLREAAVPYRINPRLVRGLDYYNRTVFEWTTTRLGAQATFCAGGRYDSLIEQLGGRASPACGFAMGMERVMLLWQDGLEAGSLVSPDLYVVHQGERAQPFAFRAAELLRSAGFAVVFHCGGGGFKSQMKKADASGAAFAVIVGDDEAAAGMLALKPLREAGEQVSLAPEAAAEWLAERLYGDDEA